MKAKPRKTLLLTCSTFLIVGLLAFNKPTDWHKAGSTPKFYNMGIEEGTGRNGSNAATIQSIPKKKYGFGTLLQSMLPDKYLGKRIRMRGYIKTKDVDDWAGFWLRIDQEGSNKDLGFDNMKDGKVDRSITGTTDWTMYDLVLDVPQKASKIVYGALLSGAGQIWFDDISFEIVDTSVPTTGDGKNGNTEPRNLDFEK